jgi:hypothetical protein
MPIASPCTKICTLDPRGEICLGCARTIDEITGWAQASEAQRAAIVRQLPQRRAALRITKQLRNQP